MKEARSKPKPYNVFTHIFQIFFQDSIRPGRAVGHPAVVNLKAIIYRDGEISVKTNFDIEYAPLPRRQKKKIDCSLRNALPLHLKRRKMFKSKWQHLKDLKSILTFDCSSFYELELD